MISHSARIMGSSFAFSMITLAAGVALAGGGGGGQVTKDSIGVFNSTSDTFFLRNTNSAGAADLKVSFGPADSIPTPGDFDNNASDTVGVYSPSLGRFLRRGDKTRTQGIGTSDAVRHHEAHCHLANTPRQRGPVPRGHY